MELLARAESFGAATAFSTEDSSTTYAEIVDRSRIVASILLGDEKDLSETRVAFLIPVCADYVCVQWGIWQAGGIAVPLSHAATEPEWEYVITDSEVQCVVTTKQIAPKLESLCRSLQVRLICVEEACSSNCEIRRITLPQVDLHRRAMILYTSGTTSKPKGVVSTHANVQAQITTLIEAWKWQADDRIPLFLPLHHIHGIINVLSCALWAGATVEPFAHFDADGILRRVAADAYSVFMAVPTIYVKLIQRLKAMSPSEAAPCLSGFANMRLMVSGSAALPASIHKTWTQLTGQELLERYGMTEIGMALSNPYEGNRRPGAVGQPLPNVELRLKSESGDIVFEEEVPGEIQIKGPCVFLEYWNRADVTESSFDDGWFRTGDMAVLESGYYRIMGRQSVDIIKSGGYKLSALEIEAVLLDHQVIDECAVVGLEDETWGETVAAAIVVSRALDCDQLKRWCTERMSRYKVPKRFLVVDSLPRNAMGKITKPAVRQLFD